MGEHDMGTGISGLFQKSKDSTSIPDVKYPGNNPAKSPGKGFEWRGKGDPASGKGSWYNPKTDESWYPNLNHDPPHWASLGLRGRK